MSNEARALRLHHSVSGSRGIHQRPRRSATAKPQVQVLAGARRAFWGPIDAVPSTPPGFLCMKLQMAGGPEAAKQQQRQTMAKRTAAATQFSPLSKRAAAAGCHLAALL